jgi:hypothetical protein
MRRMEGWRRRAGCEEGAEEKESRSEAAAMNTTKHLWSRSIIFISSDSKVT